LEGGGSCFERIASECTYDEVNFVPVPVKPRWRPDGKVTIEDGGGSERLIGVKSNWCFPSQMEPGLVERRGSNAEANEW